VGLFDLVGTHPDFQGNGLGKAMMAEGAASHAGR
jgi:ribosomal protein S18 acetylase RimI-like enzyme